MLIISPLRSDSQCLSSSTWNTKSFFLTFIVLLFTSVNGQDLDQRVKLTDLPTITLFKDRLTNSRRLGPISQLRCIGSYWKCQTYSPNVVQCYNKGYDGIDVQWECKADLDKSVKFGSMKVICEGYSFAEDPYILANSCGLEYSLESVRSNRNYEYYNTNLYETSKLSNFLTLLIMIVIILAVYKTCNKSRELELRREINGTYAHVIDGPIGDMFSHPHLTNNNPTSTSPYASPLGTLFPPPPPPYGSLVPNASTNPTPTTNSTTNSTNPSSTSSSGGAVTASVSGGPVVNTANVMTSASTSAALAQIPPLEQRSSGENKPNDESATSMNVVNNTNNTWGSFFTGASAVSGYLLNRRNTSPRRSDSPPPTYEETRGIQTTTSGGGGVGSSTSGPNSRR